jgi:hypothetical protein
LAQIDTYVYDPSKGFEGYLDQAQQLVPPSSSCIGFAHSIPADTTKSPYPEKIVMAFQRTFNQDPGFGGSYLTAGAQERRKTGDAWRHFAPERSGVCVRLVSYGPPEETESEIRAFGEADLQGVTDLEARSQSGVTTQATVQAPAGTPPIRAQVETWHQAPGESPGEIRLRWTLVRQESKDEQDGPSTEGQWKIDDVREIK